jgi:hypothetical protein
MLDIGGEYGTDAPAKAQVEKVAQIDAFFRSPPCAPPVPP